MHTDRMDWWESAREANAELKALRLETGGGVLARLKRWRRKRSLIAHIRFCDPPPGWLELLEPPE